VQRQSVDCSYLASSKVDTPDPRRENPPIGENLLLSWSFPKSLFDESLKLKLDIRLWSNKEEVIYLPIDRKRDYASIFFPNSDPILTYRIQAIAANGGIVETWEHQFWTPLIQTKSSVSSHPKHGSVMETP
jgi:hypothetical protein